MPKPAPPSFSDRAYWDARFTRETEAFDWLLPAQSLDDAIKSCLAKTAAECSTSDTSKRSTGQGKVLHIGCGSSELSLRLRDLVKEPGLVWNTDYSNVAVELGNRMERQRWATPQTPSPDSGRHVQVDAADVQSFMHWKVLDLLDNRAVQDFEPSHFDLIVDKSTSDAISCGQDVRLDVSCGQDNATEPATIHPLHLLANHLARLTPTHGRWIVISYSSQRFPFLDPLPASLQDGLFDPIHEAKGSMVDPAKLWVLENKQEMQVESVEAIETKNVFRPKEVNWLYILRRTDVAVPNLTDV